VTGGFAGDLPVVRCICAQFARIRSISNVHGGKLPDGNAALQSRQVGKAVTPTGFD
jgi:hypothetical protein